MTEDDLNATPAAAVATPVAAAEDRTAGRVVRNASALAVAMIAARLAGFGLAIVMGRHLGASEYGRYGFANALAVVVGPLADLGITTYFIRESARDRARGDALVPRLLRAKLSLFGVVAVVATGATVALSSSTTAVMIVLLVLFAGLADGFSYFAFGYFRGREQMGFEGKLTAATSLIRSAGAIVLVIATNRLVPVLVFMLAASAVQLAIALRRLRRTASGPAPASAGVPVEWRTVGAMGLFFLLTMIYTRSDSVLVGWLNGDRAVGLYTAAYTLMLGLQIAPFVVATALAPVFARTHDRAQEVFRNSWHQGIRMILVISLPFSLVVSLLGRPIMQKVFGGEFGAGGTALAIVVWCSPLVAFNTVLTGAVRGARRETWLTVTAVIGAVVNVGLNLWVIPEFGIGGAAATTVGTELLVCAVLGELARRRGVVPLPRLPYGRLLLSLLALAGAAVAARGLPVAGSVALALTAYALVIVATGVVGRSDLALVRGGTG